MTTRELVETLWSLFLMKDKAAAMMDAMAFIEDDRKVVVEQIVGGLRTEFFNPDSVVAKDFLEKVRRWGNDIA